MLCNLPSVTSVLIGESLFSSGAVDCGLWRTSCHSLRLSHVVIFVWHPAGLF